MQEAGKIKAAENKHHQGPTLLIAAKCGESRGARHADDPKGRAPAACLRAGRLTRLVKVEVFQRQGSFPEFFL